MKIDKDKLLKRLEDSRHEAWEMKLIAKTTGQSEKRQEYYQGMYDTLGFQIAWVKLEED